MNASKDDKIKEIESRALKGCENNRSEGVIVVDSIEEFMKENGAIPLQDLDRHLHLK